MTSILGNLSPYAPEFFTTVVPPTLPSTVLSAEEQSLFQNLGNRLTLAGGDMRLRNAYYEGWQRINDLGISVPPQLAGLRTVTGGPRIVVDALEERLGVEGFRLPNSDDLDEDIQAIFQANDLDSEHSLAHLDALIYRKSFIVVGADGPAGFPMVTVESPLTTAAILDPRTRLVRAALQSYSIDGTDYSALHTLDQTLQLSRQPGGVWTLEERDSHNFGVVPVVQLTNRARTGDREGFSELTDDILSITDATCRTLLGLEIAREFYSVPQKYALGAAESDFQNPDGSSRTGWETSMSKFLALERDEDGEIPTVGQFTAYDPSVYTKIIDMYARNMASVTRYPPSMFGLFSEGNPASADAIRMAQDGLIRKAKRKQVAFGSAWEQAMRLALMFANGGRLPADASRMETAWTDPGTITISALTDALAKQVQSGIIPPNSDVTWEMLGYTPTQRDRLKVDAEKAQAQMLLAQVATNVEAKDVRTGVSIDKRLHPGPVGPPPTPA